MSRKTERRLIKITGIWQIIHGIFTILYFSIFKNDETLISLSTVLDNQHDLQVVNRFIYLFGMVIVGMGIFNLVAERNYMKDNTISKISIWLIINGIVSYFAFDFISLALGMSAAVIYLAKNKAIRKLA